MSCLIASILFLKEGLFYILRVSEKMAGLRQDILEGPCVDWEEACSRISGHRTEELPIHVPSHQLILPLCDFP